MSEQEQTQQQPEAEQPAEEEVMPACRLARFPPKYYMDLLTPYTVQYENLQAMLFWRRPLQMAILLCLVELCFCFVYTFDLGLLSVLAFAAMFYHVWQLFRNQIVGLVSASFRSEYDRGQEDESNHIYPLLPFCQRFSHLSSTIVDAWEKHVKKNASGEASELIKSIIVCAALALLFAVTGTFWFLFVIVHLFLLAPGIIMHPKAFPYTQPYILKFAAAIKCPYCHPPEDKPHTD